MGRDAGGGLEPTLRMLLYSGTSVDVRFISCVSKRDCRFSKNVAAHCFTSAFLNLSNLNPASVKDRTSKSPLIKEFSRSANAKVRRPSFFRSCTFWCFHKCCGRNRADERLPI